MDQSLFAKLPSELRDRIYELSLTVYDITIYDVKGHGKFDWASTICYNGIPIENGTAHLSALTRTCKDIRRESIIMFYTLNHFAIGCPQGFIPQRIYRHSWVRSYRPNQLWSLGIYLATRQRFRTALGKQCWGLIPSVTIELQPLDAGSPHDAYRVCNYLSDVIQQMGPSGRLAGPSLGLKMKVFIEPAPGYQGSREYAVLAIDTADIVQSLSENIAMLAERRRQLSQSGDADPRSPLWGVRRVSLLLDIEERLSSCRASILEATSRDDAR